MKLKSNQVLSNSSHYVPSVSNNVVSPTPKPPRTRARKLPLDSNLFTYAQLKTLMQERVAAGDGVIAKSSLPNAMSALRDFMVKRGLSDEQPIGSSMRASFYKNLQNYLDELREAGQTGPYISNRKSLMGRWRKALLKADREAASSLNRRTPFQDALQQLMVNGRYGQQQLARDVGLPLSTLKRWLKGHEPQRRSRHWVRALETHFGVVHGTLADLLPAKVKQGEGLLGGQADGEVNAYRERLKMNAGQRYAVLSPGDALRIEWQDYFEHKTCRDCGEVLRSPKGRWATTTLPVASNLESRWFAYRDGEYCATAAITWRYVADYLGWLTLDKQHGGLGMPSASTESLVSLADVAWAERYVKWRRKRSGGKLHHGIKAFLQLIAALTNPVTGYLTQSRLAFSHAPSAQTAELWDSMCKRAYRFARASLKDDDAEFQVSRDSFAPIKHLLSMPNPIRGVIDAIRRHEADRPLSGGVAEAIWARDRLMLKLFVSNPLRVKNMMLLTISGGDSDDVAQLRNVNGVWRIAIPRHHFKNARGAARNRDYDMPVRCEVSGDLERYLKEYRPLLAAPDNPYLFVSSANPAQPMYKMNRRFETLSRRYFVGCPGVGPHVMRHIVATAILKARPGDWAAAAGALHDQEATVRKHYARLTSDDTARWLDAMMTESFA